ncbi:unnamed protein product [Tetraodon nigroviridis]|uniref:(spotted green pufferfish) hypothetical protein n=1 Tax=Tetraodon nigroviridis TaxID=99883 RepID=Q4RWY1_TETNG|nr:unnamed protein product [Tetraodon nigroviridis]
MRTLLLLAAISGLLASLAAVPTPPAPAYHAFCTTIWLLGTPCAEVAAKLVQQIKAFSPMSGCAQCGYTLVEATPLSIQANHTSAAAPLGENVTFTLSPTMLTGGCRVGAHSTSLGFTSLLDDGLNYCNLHNLLTGPPGKNMFLRLHIRPALQPQEGTASISTAMRTLLLLVAISGLLASLAAVPTPPASARHAFCKTIWLFETPCAGVATKLVQQIKAFSPMSGCAQCGYTLVAATPLSIQASHTSAAAPLGENLTFTLRPTMRTRGCRVSANSMSIGVTSRLDNGLNYCNLHNLLTASGLNLSPGFMELTNEWACLGARLSTCTY